MTVFQAIVLGIVQGLSEFLPISSSAHLTLVPYVLGWSDPGLAFDVALHVGTLVAVLAFFWREWVSLLLAAKNIVVKRRIETDGERRVLYLLIATIPGAIAGKLLNDLAETTFRSPLLIAGALIVVGVLLWWVDHAMAQERQIGEMGWKDALLIGLAQVCALVPGVSRSGATITTGRALRLTREGAAIFSFLISMPIIAGAALLKVPHVLKTAGVTTPLVAGVLASAISGWLAIGVLLRFVSHRSYGVFAIYRVVIGIAVIVLVLSRGG